MSTITTIYIKTDKTDEVIDCLQLSLQKSHPRSQIKRSTSDSVEDIYGDSFINSENDPPTVFAVGVEQSAWTTIHYNSFLFCRDLLAELSLKFKCPAVLLMGQSVSSAYLLSVYGSGEHLRTLEFADGEWIKHWGTPLSFESKPLGQNIGSEAEPFYVFEEEDVSEYCANIGLNPWGSADLGYTLLSVI